MRGGRGVRGGGGGARPAPPRPVSASASAAARGNAWMDALWELHCGTPLAGAVRYTDAIVEAMWEVFQPLLSELDVYPLTIAEAQPEYINASNAATVPVTDLVMLRVAEPVEHPRRHAGGGGVGTPLTAVMRSALHEQPRIVLALLEFFVAVWLYQFEARQQSSMAQSGTTSTRTTTDTAAAAAAGAAAHAASSSPPLRRVYVAVSGDVRLATPFDHLGAAQLGRLLTIKGTVIRMSPTRISCVRMSYRCGHCGVVKEQATEDGVLTYPGPCASARCRGYKWVAVSEQAVCEEVQLLRLQEHTTFFDAAPTAPSSGSGGATQHGGGSGARGGGGAGSQGTSGGGSGMHVMIEVELRPPWLDAVTVGDGVCVTGLLETRRSEGKQGGGMQQVCLRARAVRSLRSQGTASDGDGGGAGALAASGIAAMQHRQRNGALLCAAPAAGPGGGGGGPWRASVAAGAGLGGGGRGAPSRRSHNGYVDEEGDDEADFFALGGGGAGTGGSGGAAHHGGAGVGGRPSVGLGAASGGVDGWSAEEAGRFYEVARHPQWFTRLAASVAPSIFGMELVKQALLLAIVGGNRDKNGGETRSSIHVLLVGDPGLGKSQLLRAACAVAPRSAFVCAHTSSSCGLTMTLTRDPVSGETTFEAGAVVHGDGGITCLDEIDKGVQEHKALLEVMEQETVSLAKAGMIFSMPVRTSLLAAGNPIGGRFDVSKSLAANVNLSPALLSRFDIIACLRNPHGTNGKLQQALTDHVLQWHRRAGPGGEEETGRGGHRHGARGHATRGDGAAGPLPLPLVQRFLLFCRAQCQPTLCREACAVLQAHYLAQRQHLPKPQYGLHNSASATASFSSAAPQVSPASSATGLEATVTPRYLQALIRVSEARAKLELRHEVTREDAEYAVQLLQSCLHSFDGLAAPGSAAVGANADGGVAAGSTKTGKLNQRDAVLQRLKLAIVEENHGVNLFTEQAVLDVCESVGCRSAAAMLRQLNEFGFLLQKAGNKYCLRGC